MYISDRDFKGLVGTRACWFAQMDKEDKSSWSSIIGDYVSKLSPKEFINHLPCKGNGKSCKILNDMIPRVHHEEPNYPCAFILENPYLISDRIKKYNSSSKIMKKWLECEKFIPVNPSNEYNKIFIKGESK